MGCGPERAVAGFEKRLKRYPTDLEDEEWLSIQPFLPSAAKRGRKPATDLRNAFGALRYLARTQSDGECWRSSDGPGSSICSLMVLTTAPALWMP
ncbi:transposase [Acetobacter estunensis]|uniref:transposase n=1 Tax=Acetobacter estunensis TaxID=104097 RepID=UPI0038D2573A